MTTKLQRWISDRPGAAALTALAAVGVVALVVVGALVLAADGGREDRAGDQARQEAVPSSPTTSSSVPPASTTTTEVPHGELGRTDGAGRDLAPGVTAQRFQIDPTVEGEAGRTGRISVAGPGGVTLLGSYWFADDENWVITVDGAEGALGGVALGDAGGEISSVGARVHAAVTVALPDHPRVVPAWDQDAALHIGYGGGPGPGTGDTPEAEGLIGDVVVSTARGDNAIALRGPVADDGSYALAAQGQVQLGGSVVPLSGSYQGRAGVDRPDHRWTIGGLGAPGTLGDVPVTDLAVTMTEAEPGVTGTAGLTFAGSRPLRVDTALAFVDEGNWELTAQGASTRTWSPVGVPALTAATEAVTGAVTSTEGVVAWAIRSPMRLVDEALTMTGTVTLRGLQRVTVEVTDASGSVLGVSGDVDFGTVRGKVQVDGATVSGAVLLTAQGELLVDLPDGWVSHTELWLRFTGGPDGPQTASQVTYSMVNGASRLQLEGVVDSSSAFSLDVTGALRLAQGSVPFGGMYRSAGYVVDGAPLTEPAWELSGAIAQAQGGSVPLGHGAALVDGSIGLRSQATTPARLQARAFTPAAASSFSGEVEVQLSQGDPFTLVADLDYVDDDDWVLTVRPAESGSWTPPGMAGLTIDLDSISGDAVSEAGEVTWRIVVGEAVWEDITTGVTLTTGFSISEDCPLDEHCPDAEGLFVGFHDGEMTFPDAVPDLALEGAFLADGSWARFEARPDDVTFNGIELADTAFTMWKGPRSDTFDPNLVMPDLRASNNDFGLEFCGTFRVEVPDVATLESGGCASWSPEGVVLAQVGTGGDIESGESNGVRIGNVTLEGYAWTDLETDPVVTITGIEVPLGAEVNQLAATMHIPADLMKATGNADADATIAATGWFGGSDFSLDGAIDVSMRSGGFTLDRVSVHIGKDGDQFSLGLGADATVSMSGNHFPVSAYVGVETGGGSNEIVVRLSAQGAVSEDPDGGFELPTLLPAGTFEPDYEPMVDGAFDSKPASSLLNNGDFEDAVDSENLFTNGDLEAGAGDSLLPDGDFEGGAAGNLLVNGDLEDTDVVINGDFETGDAMGWPWSSGYAVAILADVTAPTEDEGATALELRNTQSSGTTSTTAAGLFQNVAWAPTSGATYTLSVWARSADQSTRSVALYVEQKGTASGCSAQATATTTQTFAVDGNWTLLSLPVTGVECRGQFTLTVNPVQGGAKVQLDALRFELTDSPVVVDIPGTERPSMRSTTGTSFDALPPITRSSSSDVALTSDFGNPGSSLTSNGNGRWWQFNKGTYGDISGDFDLSYDVYFASSGDRDIFNLGFWLSGSGSSPTGYAFRVQSSNDDSGFYSIKSGSKTRVSGDANFSPLVRGVWHRVRLTAVGSYVTATITRVDTGEQIYRRTMTMPSGNRAGVLGQVSDGRGAKAGHRVDNLHVYSASQSGQAVRFDPGTARSGNQYLAMSASTAGWNMLAASGEAPEVGEVYTFTAWARSTETLTGTVSIETEGGTREVATAPFATSATGAWVRATVTLPIAKTGHTGLRVGFTGMTPANVELQVDDLVLQEVGWQASPTTPAGLNALVIDDGSQAHSGLGSLLLIDRSGGTSSLYRDLAAPQVGATYTASAWLYSPVSSNAALRLTARGGTDESNVATFATTPGWREYRVTLPVTRSGHSALRLAVEVRSASGSVNVDDIVVSATGNELPQSSDTAWSSSSSGTTFDTMPPISRASDVSLVSDFGNPGSSLRSDGNGSWWQFNPDSYGYTQGDFDLSYDVYFPATSTRDILNLGFWLTGSGTAPTGYAFRVQSDFPDGGFYAVKSGGLTPVASDAYVSPLPRDVWHRVRLAAVGSDVTATIVRIDTGEQVYQRTLTMPAGNRAGVFGQVSDAAGASVGHRVDNLVVSKGSRAPTIRVLHDPAGARTGTAYLELANTTTTSGSMARTVAATPTPGATYVATAWVRAPGAAVSGALTLSTGLDSVAVPFAADGQWREVTVELPITEAGATGLTMGFDNKTAGTSVAVDDVSARLEGRTQPNPWIGVPGPNGSLATAVWSDPALAHGGDAYLAVEAGGAAGRVVSTATATPAAGSQHTASAWVRSPSGSTVQGALELVAEGGDGSSHRTPFTATDTWQQVYVTLPITQTGVTALRTEVEVSTPGQVLHVDDVQLRPVADWAQFGPPEVGVDEVVVLGEGSAASGPGHLRVRSTGAGGGVTATSPTAIRPGGSYTMQAYVRASAGAPLAGHLRLTAAGTGEETATVPFTADGEWRHVELTLTATRSNTALVPAIELDQAGELDLDQITVTPDVIVQDDPWTIDVVPGGAVDATVYEDPVRAHDSSGLLVVTTTGPAGGGVSHAVAEAPTPGITYAASAWVRAASGTPVQGQLRVEAVGGTPTEVTAGFTADGTWQQVSVRLPITDAGHTGLRTSLVIDTPGVELDVDDVKVQPEVWTPFGVDADQVDQIQVNDGARAESGNGYLRVAKATAAEGGVQLDTPGAVAPGTSQTVSAYVRSSDGVEVPGRLRLVATGGVAEDVASAEFRAGAEWRKVTVTLPVSHSDQTGLRTQLLVDEAGVGLDVDSVTVGQEPLGHPDGVTNPLPHPERGYAYLWSDAFGIKGAHLWSLTAQIQIVNGSPGLGVGGTVYFDPTAMPGVMTGTDWLKGDMTLNVSRAEPCLSFGFDGTGTDTRVEIDGGVFSTSKFELGFAPRGCEVGDRVVPVGSSLAFDTELGDASIHLDLEIGRDDADLPTFYADVAVHDLVLAGTRYDTMSLLVDVSAASAYVGFVGDFTLPMGTFSGDFELSVNAELLHLEGQVSVRDWKMAGGSFDIDEFNYYQVLDVPFGAGACASFSAGTDGRMSMGAKRYVFDGALELDCGALRVLHIEFDYLKRNVAYGFEIDYDAGNRMLAGGVDFEFERKTSWKFFGKRYRRHPKFQVALDFAMNVDKPSSASLRIYGKVSVSGGSGSLDCSLNSGGDDGCSIHVRINRFGGHTYRSSW